MTSKGLDLQSQSRVFMALLPQIWAESKSNTFIKTRSLSNFLVVQGNRLNCRLGGQTFGISWQFQIWRIPYSDKLWLLNRQQPSTSRWTIEPVPRSGNFIICQYVFSPNALSNIDCSVLKQSIMIDCYPFTNFLMGWEKYFQNYEEWFEPVL